MIRKPGKLVFLTVIIFLSSVGCQKITHGYLSDRIFYQVNPLMVPQGVTTVSAPLVIDGSTQPLNVELIGLKDSQGKNVDSILLKPGIIRTFTGTVTYADSTLDLLNAKLNDSSVAPFSIAKVGGRLQFTPATVYVPAGDYNLDIRVSNVRGGREIDNACQMSIVPMNPDQILYQAATTSDASGNFSAGYFLPISITRDPNGPNKIIFKFLDKNGKAFDPAKGEVVGRTGRPNFRNWNPYYPEVKTDSTIEYQYPSGVPQIPIYSSTVISNGSSWTGGIIYYQVPLSYTVENVNVNPVSELVFYATTGTFTVTYFLNNVTHK